MEESDRMVRRPVLLVLGPLPNEGDFLGGTKVSFSALVAWMEEHGSFTLRIVDTGRSLKGAGSLKRLALNFDSAFRILRQMWKACPSSDLVMANLSSYGVFRLGPWVWCVTKLRRRRLVLRIFGGDFDLAHERMPWLMKMLAKATILRSDLILFQTQVLVARFGGSHVEWFPTTRSSVAHRMVPVRRRCRRLLYISRLSREKGIDEVLQCADGLDGDTEIVVYGEPDAGFDMERLRANAKVNYQGSVSPSEVRDVLAGGDLLLFPSVYKGEGYPGIIIEAFMEGVPVIATRWRALPELVVDGVNGLIIDVLSAKGLESAIRKLCNDQDLYARLSRGASEAGEKYREEMWYPMLEKSLIKLVTANPP